MICQHWFRQWLGAIRHQVITQTIVEPDLCCHMMSLDCNELMMEAISQPDRVSVASKNVSEYCNRQVAREAMCLATTYYLCQSYFISTLVFLYALYKGIQGGTNMSNWLFCWAFILWAWLIEIIGHDWHAWIYIGHISDFKQQTSHMSITWPNYRMSIVGILEKINGAIMEFHCMFFIQGRKGAWNFNICQSISMILPKME